MGREYEEWASCHETDEAVAEAIHDVASGNKTPVVGEYYRSTSDQTYPVAKGEVFRCDEVDGDCAVRYGSVHNSDITEWIVGDMDDIDLIPRTEAYYLEKIKTATNYQA